MTQVALRYGCLAEQSIRDHVWFMPLFFLSHGCLDRSAAQYAETLKELLAAGYDIEFRNSCGQTPLLYAAFRMTRRTLTVLKLFLTKTADKHAVDNKGRGALHCCLSWSDGLFDSFNSVCTRSTSTDTAEHCFTGDVNNSEISTDMIWEEEIHSITARTDVGATNTESDIEYCYCGSDDAEEWGDTGCYWCDGSDHHDDKDYLASFRYCGVRDIDDFDIPDLTLSNDEDHDDEPEHGCVRHV